MASILSLLLLPITHIKSACCKISNDAEMYNLYSISSSASLSASTFSSSKYIPLSSNSKHFKFNGSQRKDILVSPGLKHGVGAVLYLQQVVRVKATQLCLSLCDPMDYTVHGILQARILEWLLQGIFPTPGSNPGLPCCRQILYQLSHKGSPQQVVGEA